MKTTLMTAALALLMTSGAAHAQEFTQQECEKVWSKENWALEYKKCKEADPQSSCRLFVEPPNYTCVRLTEPFLVGLQGASKAQVIEAMRADGLPEGHDGLRFLSIPDGGVIFTFKNDRVIIIVAGVNAGQFIWNPSYLPLAFPQSGETTCSDLPGSRYARCDKKTEDRR